MHAAISPATPRIAWPTGKTTTQFLATFHNPSIGRTNPVPNNFSKISNIYDMTTKPLVRIDKTFESIGTSSDMISASSERIEAKNRPTAGTDDLTANKRRSSLPILPNVIANIPSRRNTPTIHTLPLLNRHLQTGHVKSSLKLKTRREK